MPRLKFRQMRRETIPSRLVMCGNWGFVSLVKRQLYVQVTSFWKFAGSKQNKQCNSRPICFVLSFGACFSPDSKCIAEHMEVSSRGWAGYVSGILGSPINYFKLNAPDTLINFQNSALSSLRLLRVRHFQLSRPLTELSQI